jgi:hypothetical protein
VFCDSIAAAGPLKYGLKAFLLSVAPFEDLLNVLPLTFVLEFVKFLEEQKYHVLFLQDL